MREDPRRTESGFEKGLNLPFRGWLNHSDPEQNSLGDRTRYRLMDVNELGDLLLEPLPPDGSTQVSERTRRQEGR